MRLPARLMNNANETNSSRPSARPTAHLYALRLKYVRFLLWQGNSILMWLSFAFFQSECALCRLVDFNANSLFQ